MRRKRLFFIIPAAIVGIALFKLFGGKHCGMCASHRKTSTATV
jgi:hypothetical protein